MTRPLRSRCITHPSSLLRVVPPLCLASVRSSLRVVRLDFSLYIEATGSKVPCPSLICALAAFVPDAAWARYRLLPRLSWSYHRLQFRRQRDTVSTPHQRFTCVRLRRSHLMRSRRTFCTRRFPQRLLTAAVRAGLWPGPVTRPRGTYPHLRHSFSLHTTVAVLEFLRSLPLTTRRCRAGARRPTQYHDIGTVTPSRLKCHSCGSITSPRRAMPRP